MHPGHFNYEQALSLAKQFNAKKTILTNLHVELDYNEIKKDLASNWFKLLQNAICDDIINCGYKFL